MDFPTGALQKEVEVRTLDKLLEELQTTEFTGVIKYINDKTGNLLIIDGDVRAATFGELGGEKALEHIWNAVNGTLAVYALERERAEFALKWYTDIHGFSSLSAEILDHNVDVPVPNVEDLIKMLEREGISHLMAKKPDKVIKKRAHKNPAEILGDIHLFLTTLFGDFMAENIIKSHLMKLDLDKTAITIDDLSLLASEIRKNVLERVMDEKRAKKESKRLRELLGQK
ncbi:MAG: DUF2226 domain-containing protein [Candidatus Methanofastidiosia archaeon]|jgi:hypothetical protein